jgi:hypothetical protein
MRVLRPFHRGRIAMGAGHRNSSYSVWGGHPEVAERAESLEVGQRGRCGAHRGVAEVLRVERIDGEGDAVDRAGGAVAAREGADGVDGVPGDGHAGLRGRGDGDRGDAGLVEGLELARIDQAEIEN